MGNFQLNRRQMLATSAVGGAAMFWSQRVSAADDLNKLSFVVVSDTHLGRKNNQSSEKQWRAAIAEINKQPGQFVLHLGDVVDSGREEQYPIYVETRKALNKPIHEIPGNHDPNDLFQKYVTKQTDRFVDYGGVRFILFDNAHRDSHDGFITSEQIDWLKTQCADATLKKLKIVMCCHVPIHSNKNPDRGWYVKPSNGQKAFYELQQRYADRILACLHGHFHNGIRGWRDHGNMVEVLCPSVCYNQNRGLKDRIADGKATGFFVDELRPGYVLAELGEGYLKLRYKPLGKAQTGEYEADWR
ncbi:metallophosphoesterase [uncultured Gimesia sp.]|uniref:metallophosphoesterase family protein n=1 Tax=uncultured Gimesia sp. TaxID=1678688 RepID=UPI0026104E8C|nr:metallophosphoesterase [uncultured Gimesia sp.]